MLSAKNLQGIKREREKIADNIRLAEAKAQILMQYTIPLA